MKKKNGFTLVELIAAITILGVLLLIGSQVVIDTMNKNKAKAVYTSIDNLSKQARLTFLDDPEEWDVNGYNVVKASMNINEKDMEFAGSADSGPSRISCLNIGMSTSKFKNIKFEYFLKENDLYCSYDVGFSPVYHFKPKNAISTYFYDAAKNRHFYFQTFTHPKREEDYYFYLKDSWQCINKEPDVEYNIPNNETLEVHGVTKDTPLYQLYENSESIGSKKITDEKQIKEVSKKKVLGICKTFISEEEFYKYYVD